MTTDNRPGWKQDLDAKLRSAKVGLSKPGNEDVRLMDSKGLYSTKAKALISEVESLAELTNELQKALYEIKAQALNLGPQGVIISRLAASALDIYEQGQAENQTQNLSKLKKSLNGRI